MVMVKKRLYNEYPQTNLATLVAPPIAPVNVAHQTNPFTSTATYLRLRAAFYMDVRVGTPDPPPTAWWPPTTVTLVAFYASSTSSTVGNSVGSSEHYLGSQMIAPRVVADPTVAGEYTVQWIQQEDLVLDTSRTDTTSTTGAINVGIVVFDPYAALSGIWASIGVDYSCRLFTLWGQQP